MNFTQCHLDSIHVLQNVKEHGMGHFECNRMFSRDMASISSHTGTL